MSREEKSTGSGEVGGTTLADTPLMRLVQSSRALNKSVEALLSDTRAVMLRQHWLLFLSTSIICGLSAMVVWLFMMLDTQEELVQTQRTLQKQSDMCAMVLIDMRAEHVRDFGELREVLQKAHTRP